MNARAILVGFTLATACGGDDQTKPDAAIADATKPDAALTPLPDLRFKWVGGAQRFTVAEVLDSEVGITETTTDGQSSWTPLQAGGQGGWTSLQLAPTAPSNGIVSVFGGGQTANLTSDVEAITPTPIVTSLDIADSAPAPDEDGYMLTTLAPTGGQPALDSQVLSTDPDQLAAAVADQASNGRIVTALCIVGSDMTAFAYGDVNDSNHYETAVMTADISAIGSAATQLAGSGYVITALGRTAATTYALVGTRVVGMTAPRDVKIDEDVALGDDVGTDVVAGYALMGWVFIDHSGSGSGSGGSGSAFDTLAILEK